LSKIVPNIACSAEAESFRHLLDVLPPKGDQLNERGLFHFSPLSFSLLAPSAVEPGTERAQAPVPQLLAVQAAVVPLAQGLSLYDRARGQPQDEGVEQRIFARRAP